MALIDGSSSMGPLWLWLLVLAVTLGPIICAVFL
jgi:hypothetical protein